MILEGKFYEEITDEPMYGKLRILINSNWQYFYYDNEVKELLDYKFNAPNITDLILICLKHEFENEAFNEETIRRFKQRFIYLNQYENKIELQTLVHFTMLKLEEVIKGKIKEGNHAEVSR